MFKALVYKTLLLLTILEFVQSQNSVPPVWMPNNYFQTRAVPIKQNISTTFNFTNPITANIPFTKTYTSIPKLAYGIKNYKGNDAMYQQNFDFSNTGLTQTGFTIFTKVIGITNLRIVTIVYMAVDQSYPYNLNTFNNIEANYSTGGPLVNITTGVGTQTYINNINYTQLSNTISSAYTSFGPVLQNDLVALYLNAIWNAGSSNKQINWTVTSPVIDQTHFQIKVVVLDGYKLTYLRFSIVAMDITDVQASGKFTLVYQSIYLWGNQTNYISLPAAFIDATLIGISDYVAGSANCGLDFNWQPDAAHNQIIINQSVPYYKSSAICGLTQYRVVVFYVKTWFCPPPYLYFNLGTNLCDNYCQAYFFGNQSAQACQPCDFGCYSCQVSANSSSSSGLECTSCNAADMRQMLNGTCECMMGYYQPNLTSTACVACVVVTSNCAGCTLDASNNSICTSCQSGFFILNQTCFPCTIPHCSTCHQVAGSQVCTGCDTASNYFLNGGTCELCNISECVQCSSLTTCALCDTSNGYFVNSTSNMCQMCNLFQCLICSSLSTCIVCNLTENYFLNVSDNTCQLCPLAGCIICTSLETCAMCNATEQYYVNPTTRQCDYCNNSENYFLNPVDLDCQYCSVPNCITCRSYYTCSVCDANMSYFVSTTDHLCYSCNLTGCITCATLYTCAICDVPNNYNLVNSSQSCKLCPYTCICDGYYLPQYFDAILNQTICTTICGDGMKRQLEQCDDGNAINYDGCSSTCKIENLWTCVQTNVTQYSCCNLNSSLFTMNLISTLKPLNQNAIIINLQILPLVPFLSKQNLAAISTATITGIPLYNQKKSSSGQNLTLKYNYNQSIQGMVGHVVVVLTAPNSNQPNSTCSVTVSQTIQIYPKSSNNVPFMYFSQDDYKQMDKMDNAVNSAQIISYIILFLSALPCKIVGLQLFGVLQLSYFVLAQSNFVNALLVPYMKMSGVNGLNFELQPENSQSAPDRVTSLGYRSLFLNNCNAMFFLLLAQILVGLGIYTAATFMKDISQKFHTASKYLLKQVLITLILFNSFNLAFGVGIHFTYADKNDPLYGISTLCAILAIILPLATMIGLMASDPKQFGEFRNKFKPDFMSQFYFVFTLIYKFALGYYISIMNSYQLSTLIVISFSFIFLLYNLVNLPFIDAYHNYRANVCHVTQLIILFVTNYYQSMKSTTPLQQKAYYYNAAYLQISAIYTCIGVSGICLGVQIYKYVKSKFFSQAQSSPANKSQKNMLNTTQQKINRQKYRELTVQELAY